MHQHHLSLTGGNKATHYMFSIQYFDQQGILIGTGSRKYNFRSNIDSRIGIFKVGLNLSGSKHDIEEPRVNITGDDGVMRYLTWFTRPTVPVKYSNGHYGYVDGTNISASAFKNPVDEINRGHKDNQNYRLDFQTFGEIDIISGLRFRSSLAYKLYTNYTSNFNPTQAIYNSKGDMLSQSTVNSLSNYFFLEKTCLNENILTYSLKRENSELNVLVGHSIQALRADANSWSVQKFPNDDLFVMNAGTENPGVSGNAYENSLLSFFGRINYNYNDRYLFELNLRRDGSSRMPEKNRYATFPSFSLGWIISNETFLSDIKWLSSLKLRGSWGKLGNQEIGNYPFMQTMKIGANYYFSDNKSIGLYTSQIANDQIKWETTTITDAGLDVVLWNGRISFTFDWYNKITSDILLQLAVPYTFSGIGAVPYQNAGLVQNKGWELAANYFDQKGNFRWSGGFSISGVENKIIDNGGVDAIIGNAINREGYSIRSYYGLKATGLYRTDEDVNRIVNVNGEDKILTVFGNVPKKGDIMYEDKNKDGNISNEDRVVIGNPFPNLQYSFNLGFGWKNFDLSAFFQGVTGIYRYNWEQTTLSNGGNMTNRWMDRWTENNTSGSMPRLGNTYNDTYSSFWLSKADYLRLKSLELGYTFKNINIRKLGLKDLRLYLASANLWTLSYLENYDPEKISNDSRNDAHPNSKTFSIGVNVKFY
jgi:TonB-linked SusC/RagA family outer membrane protein